MEAVHVELAHERAVLAMPKVLREHLLLELLDVMKYETSPTDTPFYHWCVLGVLP